MYKKECPPVISIFHFSTRGFSPEGFLEKKSVQGSKIKLRFTLAICLTHLSMLPNIQCLTVKVWYTLNRAKDICYSTKTWKCLCKDGWMERWMG